MIEGLLVAILGTAVGSLLARESSALLCGLSRALLDRGLRRMLRHWPGEERDRWREEIEYAFEAYSGRPLASLVFALRLRWTARRRPVRKVLTFLAESFENTFDELSEEEKAEHRRIVLSAIGYSQPLMRAYKAAEAFERLRHEPRPSRRGGEEESG